MLIQIPTYNELTQSTASSSSAVAFNCANWQAPGSAYTASSKSLYAQLGRYARVKFSRLHVVWTASNSDTRVRLTKADSGPNNIENLGPWLSPQAVGSPITGEIICTDALQQVYDAGVQKYVGFQVVGSGVIYRATLDIIWEVDVVTSSELASLGDRVTAIEAMIVTA